MCRRVRVSDGWCLAPGASFPCRRLRHAGGEGNRGHADQDPVRESARIDDDHGEEPRRYDDRVHGIPQIDYAGGRDRHEYLRGKPERLTRGGEIAMTSRNGMMWTGVAIAVALTTSDPSSAFAQAGGAAPATAPAQDGRGAGPGGGGAPGGGRGRGAPPYTPAAGAKDLKAV